MLQKVLTFLIINIFFIGIHINAETLLQTKINIFTVDSTETEAKNVQPGSIVKLKAIIQNVGNVTNKAASIFIRFSFPKPLSMHSKSLLFKTETIAIPKLAPNESTTIDFETTHKWPSFYDFVRNDWAMREYEAVIEDSTGEKISGIRAVSFSAYYYEGHEQSFPVKVQAEN